MPVATYLHNSQKILFAKLDSKGLFSYVNNHFAACFSFLQNELVGTPGNLVILPLDYDDYFSALDNCFDNPNHKCGVLLRVIKEGGGSFLTDWEFSACFDEQGKPDGVCCIGFATTEASLKQLRLEMQLQSLKMISDSSSDGILLLDKNYKIIAHNRPAEHLSLELYKKQYQPGDDFRKYIRPGAEQFFYRQFNAALHGTLNDEVFDMVKRDGTIVTLKVQMTPVYDDSNTAISGVAVITKDITQVQELNNRLNTISVMQSHQIRRPVANMISLVTLIDTSKLDDNEKEYLQLLKLSINQLEEEIRQIVNTARKG